MQSLNEEVCNKADDEVSKEDIRRLIDKRELTEWSFETAKRILKGASPTEEKKTTADLWAICKLHGR